MGERGGRYVEGRRRELEGHFLNTEISGRILDIFNTKWFLC